MGDTQMHKQTHKGEYRVRFPRMCKTLTKFLDFQYFFIGLGRRVPNYDFKTESENTTFRLSETEGDQDKIESLDVFSAVY